MVRHSIYVAVAALVVLAPLAAAPVAATGGDSVDTSGETGGGADVADVGGVGTSGETGGGADVADVGGVGTSGETGGGADVASIGAAF